MKRLILAVIAVPAIIVVGILLGSYCKVYTANEWMRFAAPDGSWAAAFPSRPILRKGPPPEPFRGEMETWTLATPTASYEIAILPPQDPALKLNPTLLAAAAATSLDGELQILGNSGRFSITTPQGTAVDGQILIDSNGKIYRALASTSDPRSQPATGSSLFLNSFAVRGARQQTNLMTP